MPKESRDPFPRGKRAPPNCFLSLRVSEPAIEDRLFTLQQQFLGEGMDEEAARAVDFAGVKRCLTSVRKMHITLGVMNIKLGSYEEQDHAAAVLREAHETIVAPLVGNVPMRFILAGLGDFSGRVVFARPEENEAARDSAAQILGEVGRRIHKLFPERGVAITGLPTHPHVTVAKTSKSGGGAKRVKRLPDAVWHPHRHEFFGETLFDRLDLCRMVGAEEDGYYRIIASVPFSSAPVDDRAYVSRAVDERLVKQRQDEAREASEAAKSEQE